MKNNKKGKLIILPLIAVICFSGTVFATTNGVFEGFNIVNVVVNNKLVKGDIPAINFNGRTMVPVRFIGEELGAEITWDSKTSTAYITSNKPVSNSGYTQEDIDKLKLYNKIADHYLRINKLGEMLQDTSAGLSLAFQGIEFFSQNKSYSVAVEQFNERVKIHNDTVKLTNNIIIEAEKNGIDTSDMYTFISNYSKSIDYYKLAFEYLYEYDQTKWNSKFESYLENNNEGFNRASKSGHEAYLRYLDFRDLIQSY